MDSITLSCTSENPIAVLDLKPNYSVTFHNEGKMVGALDFNGDVMKFEGEAEESAKAFFDWLSSMFDKRIKDAYQEGYEAAKKENI